LQYLCFYRKREKRKKRKKKAWSAHNEAGPTARIQFQIEKEVHQERPTRIWIFCIMNPDIFQKLLKSPHIFFLSSIFTSGTPYFFLFSSVLLISVGNENETETKPVRLGEEEAEKNIAKILPFYY